MDHHATLNEIDSLSMGELQRQLVTWVEEKGLLNELRAYLRKKMIFLLKDTILDQKTSIVDQICVTPKLQALALLVAEYLLSQKLFYSLSVFSTEVPTITHVNKFCQQIQNANDINENSPKLDSNEITRILEAVGISGHSELVNNIMLSYTNATDRKESLIGSILENISTAVDKLSEKNVEKLTQGTNTDEFLEGKRTINSIADLNLLFEDYHLKQHQSAVFMFIDKEHARIKSEEKAKYKSKLYKHQKTLFQEVKTREEYVLRKLNEAEVRLVTQKQQIEANLKRKQNHLQELADELGHIHNQLSRREEILSSLKQEAISALKEKPSMNICDQCKSCDHLKKQEVTKSAGQNISQEQKSLQASDSERLCERKLFSDIILGLQKENTALKDETLKHRTSIMKLKCKLAKTKSVHENKRPFYTSQLCLPVTQLIRPSSLSPIISSDKEHIPSSNSSSKSDITSVKNASSPMRIQIVGAENTENIKRKRSSLKNDDSELSTKTKEVQIHASSPVADLTRDINKYELKENNESKFTIDIAKKSETLDFSKKHKKQRNDLYSETKKVSVSDGSDEKSNNQVQNNLRRFEQKKLNVKNSFHKIEYNEQTKSEIQQTVSVQIQESSETFGDHVSEVKHEQQSIKYNSVHNEMNKNPLLDKVKPGKIMQIPNVLIDVDTSDMYEGTFKDIAKKMKPLEDCVLYSKRVPNIYYAEPTSFESAPQGDIPKFCTNCKISVEKEKFCRNHVHECSYFSRNNISSPRPCRNVRNERSDVSVISSVNSSNSQRSKRNRRNSGKINNINIEDMDENELFKKVCKSLGVPLTPISSDAERGFTNRFFGSKEKAKQVNTFSLGSSPKQNGSSDKGIELTNTNLDESALSTLSDSSRDCATPDSLILNSSSSSKSKL